MSAIKPILGITFSALVVASGLIGVAPPAMAQAPLKQFTESDKANARLVKTLNIPAFFALPKSARGQIPEQIPTTDTLVDFKHPDGGGLGLRVIETARRGMGERLGKSGLFQTGDLILSFWPDWGGAGPYPNVQMGVSHVGVAYIKDGRLNNLDNPLNAEYNAPSDLRSSNYRQVSFMHVVRPRNLTEAQRANLQAWITRFNTNSRTIYPSRLSFNADYGAPKFKAGQPVEFVKALAQAGLGQSGPKIDLYCSEFAWSLLALRDCDPESSASQFNGSSMPRCVRPPMEPMTATGDYMSSKGRSSHIGLADGPLAVIDSMGLTAAERQKQIDSVFATTRPDALRKMSPGHRETARVLGPKFAALAIYYKGVTGTGGEKQQAAAVSAAFAKEVAQNYSPTSFLINTLLPSNNPNRTMDYIATIVVK
jgi:hypothetical protein